jgi:hypothetical protein
MYRCTHSLSTGKVTLIKSVLEATLVYWDSLAYIFVGIKEKIEGNASTFYAKEKTEKGIPLVKWQRLAKSEALGGVRVSKINPLL